MGVSSLILDEQYVSPEYKEAEIYGWTLGQIQAVANECGHVMSAPFIGSGYEFARLLLAYDKKKARPVPAPVVFDPWNTAKGND